MDKLCPGCFRESASDICSQCGYDASLKRSPLILPHKSSLSSGRYYIGRILGRPGGFGITYLAYDAKLLTTVAIKEYLPRDLSSRDLDGLTVYPHSGEDGKLFEYGLHSFLEEARTLARFDHPNVVRVRDYFEENGTAYLVMDYCRGLSLAQFVSQNNEGALPEETAIAVILPILDALKELHKNDYIHRDLKPQNIYLTESGRPILLDFGAARQSMSEKSQSLSVILSEGYAPLEQYQRNGRQGPWTDVYGIVATFYNLITSKVPPSALDRLDASGSIELPGAVECSEKVRLLFRKGLEPDYTKRIQSIDELQSILISDAPSISATDIPDLASNAKSNSEEPNDKPEDRSADGNELSFEWERLYPYLQASLIGGFSDNNALDKKGHLKLLIYSIYSLGVFGACALALYLNKTYSPGESAGIDVLFLPALAGWALSFLAVINIEPLRRVLLHERVSYYMPVFKKLWSGKKSTSFGAALIFYPVAWLGYWGLWKDLAIFTAPIIFLEILPILSSIILGPSNSTTASLLWFSDQVYVYFIYWFVVCHFFNAALYKRLLGIVSPYIRHDVLDAGDIFLKSKPSLVKAAIAMLTFIVISIAPQQYLDSYSDEAEAALEVEKGSFESVYKKAVKYQSSGEHDKAALLLKPLLKVGYPAAEYTVANYYYDGNAPSAFPLNKEKAFQLYRKAAEAGYLLAETAYAECLYEGIGVTADKALGLKWYKKASDDGDYAASYSLGYIYWGGSELVKKNPDKAFEYMKKSADSGYLKAKALLGHFYDVGVGVKINKTSAISLLNTAEWQNEPVAQYLLGMKLLTGEDVTQDIAKAVTILSKAADAGIPGAQSELGFIFINGKYAREDKDLGLSWLKKAAAQGQDDAIEYLKNVGIENYGSK